MKAINVIIELAFKANCSSLLTWPLCSPCFPNCDGLRQGLLCVPLWKVMSRMTDWQVEDFFLFSGGEIFPGSRYLYLQRALKAPESEESRLTSCWWWQTFWQDKAEDKGDGGWDQCQENNQGGWFQNRKSDILLQTVVISWRLQKLTDLNPSQNRGCNSSCQMGMVTFHSEDGFLLRHKSLSGFLWSCHFSGTTLHMSGHMFQFKGEKNHISNTHIHMQTNYICILILILIYS